MSWPGHGPYCRLYDPSAGHEASVVSHHRNCILPWRLLASLPRELRFEVPIEMAREAVRIGWVAALTADAVDYLPGETIGERELGVALKVLTSRIGRLPGRAKAPAGASRRGLRAAPKENDMHPRKDAL